MKVFSFMLIFFVFCGTSFAAEGDAKIGISGPVTLVDGAAYWGANSALEYSISSRWSLGLDSGFFYRHKSYPGSTVSGWILPLLPSVFYDPAMGTAVFHP